MLRNTIIYSHTVSLYTRVTTINYALGYWTCVDTRTLKVTHQSYTVC